MSDQEGKTGAPDESAGAKAETDEQGTGADRDKSGSGWASAGAASRTAAEFEKLAEENSELKDRVLRTMAEMENLRRRTEREKAETAKYAVSNFARDVLTVGDNIQRAIDAVPEDMADTDPAVKTLLEGVEMTDRELHNVLERHGITRIDPKGERFDPNMHQAMYEIENTDVESGTVIEVVQAGYQIADRVLRPAMVGIAKGGPKPSATRAESDPDPAPESDAEAASEADTPDAVKPAAAANDDAPEPKPAPEPSRATAKTPLPDPSRAPGTAKQDGRPASGGKKPLGGRVDKTA